MESAELVPGDVYEVSDPSLTQFPCDSLLLAGDCIVNESMLTGTEIRILENGKYGGLQDTRGIRACLESTSDG